MTVGIWAAAKKKEQQASNTERSASRMAQEGMLGVSSRYPFFAPQAPGVGSSRWMRTFAILTLQGKEKTMQYRQKNRNKQPNGRLFSTK
jgi:hypothetical protein